MKIILINIVLLICFGLHLSAQSETYQSFELKLTTCLQNVFKNTTSKDSKVYFQECMHHVAFPSFCVEDIHEKVHCSKEFKDIYLVNYWFEGCAGCVAEKPFLEQLSSEFPQLKIVSLSRDDIDSVKEISSKKLNWIYVTNYENKGVPNNKGGYPLTILLDHTGKIRLALMGGIQNQTTYAKVIDEIKRK